MSTGVSPFEGSAIDCVQRGVEPKLWSDRLYSCEHVVAQDLVVGFERVRVLFSHERIEGNALWRRWLTIACANATVTGDLSPFSRVLPATAAERPDRVCWPVPQRPVRPRVPFRTPSHASFERAFDNEVPLCTRSIGVA